MYNGDNSITVFDKGNSNCRVTVTTSGEIRVKLGKDVPDSDKEIIINELIRKGKDIEKSGVTRTYRKSYHYHKLMKHINSSTKNKGI